MSANDGDGGAPEGVSRQEFTDLTSAVGELRDALTELREASTPAEKEEAKAEVREAKADLKTLAKEMGIDPKRLESAAAEARKQQTKEELRPLIIELLDEELEDVADDATDAVKGAAKDAKDAADTPPKDSEPVKDHWSDRPLSSLFGG